MCEPVQKMMDDSMQKGVQLGKQQGIQQVFQQGERSMQLRIARQMLVAKLLPQQFGQQEMVWPT